MNIMSPLWPWTDPVPIQMLEWGKYTAQHQRLRDCSSKFTYHCCLQQDPLQLPVTKGASIMSIWRCCIRSWAIREVTSGILITDHFDMEDLTPYQKDIDSHKITYNLLCQPHGSELFSYTLLTGQAFHWPILLSL